MPTPEPDGQSLATMVFVQPKRARISRRQSQGQGCQLVCGVRVLAARAARPTPIEVSHGLTETKSSCDNPELNML
jgi:hypothetical protein